MTLLLAPEDLAARREVVRGPLQPLAASLEAELSPLIDRDIYFPAQKALLSRAGGRCERDGAMLAFDPFQPHEHRCPRCGTVYRGDAHDRFWIYWYQLWLAERAVLAAALAALGAGDRFVALAEGILDGYAARYLSYPNADNVLGPSRLFFSTYLESIWLLQICLAADLLKPAGDGIAARVCDAIIQPGRALIAEFDEGASNRQVWNDVALLAAAVMLDDAPAAADTVYGPSGIAAHLSGGLLSDGTWFEGENYHLFAHRGLWYGVTMAERLNLELPTSLVDRFQLGFGTPFVTALPDLTLPSRRDSQYAISLRQWRIAEHLELGVARVPNPELLGALARLYRGDIPRRETGRSTSSADVERNTEASALDRSDLGWRGLVCARPSLPSCEPVGPRSALLPAQGIGVFRRSDGDVYLALDYGESGGGHGHPDRLNLLLADGATRWLDDFGTGSYVDPSLHWYRSTLAHNAPLVDGRSQLRVNGALHAYDERGAAGWIAATAEGIEPGVTVERIVVVLTDYSIDELRWRADRDVVVDLPFHADLNLDGAVGAMEPADPNGVMGTEDGFRFANETQRQRAAAGAVVHGRAAYGEKTLETWSQSDGDVEWWRAIAPGPPGHGDSSFRFARTRGRAGRLLTVMSWRGELSAVALGERISVVLRDGTIHTHRRTETGWHIDLAADAARSSIDLGGYVSDQPTIVPDRQPLGEPSAVTRAVGSEAVFADLGRLHYRRSEQDWADAGRPTARVSMRVAGRALALTIDVARSDLTFVPADAVNQYDNEHADINGDGVQLYVRQQGGFGAWMLVPETDSNMVRMRAIDGWHSSRVPRASWQRFGHGYRMLIELEPVPDAIDVLINEKPRGRERRRGQLVMSGAQDEFVYLRGDRYDAERLIHLRAIDD